LAKEVDRKPRRSRRTHFRTHLRGIISYFRSSDRIEEKTEEDLEHQADRKMAYEWPSNENLMLDTENVHELDQNDLLIPQPVWPNSNSDIELPDSSPLFELSGQRYIGPSDTLNQHSEINVPLISTRQLNRPCPALSVSVEGSAPAMSPASISQRTSPISPFTPEIADSIPTPVQRSYAAYNNAVTPDDDYATLEDKREMHELSVQEMPANQRLLDFDFDFGFPITVENCLGTNQEQAWDASTFTEPQTSLQPTTPSLPHLPDAGRQTPQRIAALTGTWHMNVVDATWTRYDEGAPTLRASNVDSYALEDTTSSLNHMSQIAVERNEARKLTVPRSKAKSGTKKTYPPVKCRHSGCNEEYAGRYGAGNMKRHLALKHACGQPRVYKCRGCEKVYNRSDARHTHERQKHPHLRHAPPIRRSASAI
jgi:hypothetical protein